MTASDRVKALQQLRRLSRLLDNAIKIPGTSFRFGLDPILGLIPGGGDAVSALFSTYIILQAARLGLPKSRLVEMFFNVLVEMVFGSIPLVGDLFDFAWKANAKNVALLESDLSTSVEREVAEPTSVSRSTPVLSASNRKNLRFAALLGVGLMVVASFIFLGAIALFVGLLQALGSPA